MLKGYILLGDDSLLSMFRMAYNAVMEYVSDSNHLFYAPVHYETGASLGNWIDSLAAFFPGLQVLWGDVKNAVKLHEVYATLWRQYGGLPERWDYVKNRVNVKWYPLRPELVESTYLLYRATRDPYYLDLGETMVNDFQQHTRTRCGFATIKDVFRKTQDERMESFFLSETLKYLYLLFDEGVSHMWSTDSYLQKTSFTLWMTVLFLLLKRTFYGCLNQFKMAQNNQNTHPVTSVKAFCRPRR